jgi:hypothetical protein
MNEVATIAGMTLRSQTRPLRVYLAGKITHGVPWRCEALEGFTGETYVPGGECGTKNCWFSFQDIDDALDPNAVMRAHDANGALDVIGPFFVGWDHVDAPGGAGLHAVTVYDEDPHSIKPAKIHEIRKRVHAVNLSRIKRADLVFAHIDETDCFGTLSEIGYAHGIGTPVHLHFGATLSRKQRDDMWFVTGFARSIHEDISVKTAFKCVLRWHARDMRNAWRG